MIEDRINEPNSIPGLSGKRVTLFVLFGLLGIGTALTFTMWSYSSLNRVREETRLAWRDLAEQLTWRYRRLEQSVASAVDAGDAPIAWAERFRLAIDRYRTTVQYVDQYATAREVEDLLANCDFDLGNLAPTPELEHELTRFNECLANERHQLAKPGSLFLDIFLEFPVLPAMKLTQ
ncbi:MAG: hypothetical protein KDB22_03860 [Planctomycetales bacterium]|nr:hypothetical protein [Planctomycetales bacterium]